MTICAMVSRSSVMAAVLSSEMAYQHDHIQGRAVDRVDDGRREIRHAVPRGMQIGGAGDADVGKAAYRDGCRGGGDLGHLMLSGCLGALLQFLRTSTRQ